ncbi:DUF397 domain-containing protein [Streptomyces sp. ML-6]|uniref:DUF397 domain-containing protein n=1 Tax=Streptomyces sp. ML-6 TaxID=2982693 RepID=UPI0024C04411|nr:DUF397 domain-containing protein [Streptomyces sp. ML-6]MDK0520623.1 DUF397 domain-containing protein [Streptomyces sp. ML-6]
MPEPKPSGWFKSSYSDNGGNCIEVATDLTAVRDSKTPHGPALATSPASFAAFVAGVKTGEFGTV